MEVQPDTHAVADGAGGPPYLRTLGNGLRVLTLLAESEPVSLRLLAEKIGMNRPATYRLLYTLVEHGFVVRDPSDDTYRIGSRVWELGVHAINQFGIRQLLSEQLRRLSKEYGETVHLAIYASGEVVYIDKADGWHPITSYSQLGGRAPAYCVATGKVLLARESEREVQSVIDAGLVQYTPETIAEPTALRHELQAILNRGYSVNRGEWRPDVGGVGVVIAEPLTGELLGLGFSGPTDRILARSESLAQALLEVKASLQGTALTH